MYSDSLIQLVLTALGCSQKELAQTLGVSPTQISKWKKGEYISHDMESRLRRLAGIGDHEPDFVLWAGSVKDADKWARLLRFLASLAAEGAETGYNTPRLEESDEESLMHWHTFLVLKEMGIDIPNPFPPELDFDYDADEPEERLEELLSNPYVELIHDTYKSYTDVYGFYAAYVSELIDKLDPINISIHDIESELLCLAASKLENIPDFAISFREFKWKTNNDYTEWLTSLKEEAFRAGIPLRAELLDMVHGSHESLGHSAEAESLGFNASRIHPDVYMNELLVGMRIIHQVLPVIMDKLGIDEEFKLDESNLSLN